MADSRYDVAIIGGGIVGAATALAITRRWDVKLVVIETERELAAHQTGHNSGVIHSGLYYKPGSLKARNCTTGREELYAFCAEHNVLVDRCGKLVVACDERELAQLDALQERGKANGLDGIKRLRAEEISEYEPHVRALGALHIPQTGIVDFPGATRKYGELAQKAGADLRLGTKFLKARPSPDELIVTTSAGELTTRFLINCGGLHSDRVAWACGVPSKIQIIPFRGEYFELVPDRCGLVKNLIYPVPDARFPFLGVHFTRMVKGGIEAGPNAVLAFHREGYRGKGINVRDVLTYATYPGFWRLVLKFWRTGMYETYRSWSRAAFLRDLQRLIPELQASDIHPAGAGVRAMAVAPNGSLVDDFLIERAPRMIHVLNAPSPAATASLAIGREIAQMAGEHFELGPGRPS